MPTTFANSIDNNPIYATRAEQDKDGNQIDTTYAKSSSLATVASSGSYTDLSNTPTIPTVDQAYNASSTNAQSGTAVAGAIATVRQVPASTSSDENKVLTVDSLGAPSWAIVPDQSTGLFEALYGVTTYADIAQAIADKKIVYCRISAYTKSSRMAFLAYIGYGSSTSTSGHIEFQYYRSNSDTTANDSVFVYDVDYYNTWTTTERSAGIKTQVNADWNASSGAAQILNKPTIPSGEALVPAHSSSDSGKVLGVNSSGNTEWVNAGGGGAQVQSNWTESDPTAVSYIQNKPNLATVATSGSYNDLTNTPTIPAAQVNADWNSSSGVSEILNKPNLATVATSGSYNDLSNKPTIPTLATLNTAGITDIQQVSALPASPVATVLYLIPES